MSGELLRRYVGSRPVDAEPADSEPAFSAEDLQSFGYLRRAIDRALMLELRYKDGRIEAFSYAWLERAEFNPSDGIALYFGRAVVRLIGRNLNSEIRPNLRLFAALVRHQVPWIQEADGATAMAAPDKAVVIDQIIVK